MSFKSSWKEVILDKTRAVLHRQNAEGTIPSEQKVIKKSSGGKLVAPIHAQLAAPFKKPQFLGRRGASSAGVSSLGTRHNCCCSGVHRRGNCLE